jgi:hypothetical protein
MIFLLPVNEVVISCCGVGGTIKLCSGYPSRAEAGGRPKLWMASVLELQGS